MNINQVPFVKMHGTGNKFVIIDIRFTNPTQSSIRAKIIDHDLLPINQSNCSKSECNSTWHNRSNIKKMAQENNCDQIILVDRSNVADCLMHIYNADGSKAETCGNAARCIGYLIMSENGTEYATIELVNKYILECVKVSDKSVKVNMGKPRLKWNEIPLSVECDTLFLPIELEILKYPTAVNIGNPHIVFFVDNVDHVALENYGPKLENHTLFPQKTNVSVVQIQEPAKEINLKTWERGTGITASCGSAACAALVASILRGYITTQQTTVHLPGGKLLAKWQNHVFMTGDIEFL